MRDDTRDPNGHACEAWDCEPVPSDELLDSEQDGKCAGCDRPHQWRRLGDYLLCIPCDNGAK